MAGDFEVSSKPCLKTWGINVKNFLFFLIIKKEKITFDRLRHRFNGGLLLSLVEVRCRKNISMS
jgi:hypothetical protein